MIRKVLTAERAILLKILSLPACDLKFLKSVTIRRFIADQFPSSSSIIRTRLPLKPKLVS
jgi:hypothetical protein